MNKTPKWQTLWWVVFLLATGYQLICCFQSPSFLLQNALVLDDAFYYLQTARNVANLGWVTFDGIHATSGVQLLWEALLILLAMIFPGRTEFLRAMLVFSTFLNAIAGWLLYCAGTTLFSKNAGAVATIIWSAFMVRLHPTFMGMEYSLHVVIILCTILLLWQVIRSPESTSTKTVLLLAIFLTLNFWTRLDSAAYSCMIVIGVMLVFYRMKSDGAKHLRKIVLMGSVLILGAVIYMCVCMQLAGTPAPISGLVKSHRSLLENYLRSENIQYLADVDFHDMSMRFRQKWNHSQWFRGIVRWQDWHVLHKESAEVPIYVLRKND